MTARIPSPALATTYTKAVKNAPDFISSVFTGNDAGFFIGIFPIRYRAAEPINPPIPTTKQSNIKYPLSSLCFVDGLSDVMAHVFVGKLNPLRGLVCLSARLL